MLNILLELLCFKAGSLNGNLRVYYSLSGSTFLTGVRLGVLEAVLPLQQRRNILIRIKTIVVLMFIKIK